MNRFLFLALVATAAVLTTRFADPPVNLQAVTPGTQQVGHINVSGKVLAGTISATDPGSSAQAVAGNATATSGANFGGIFKTSSTLGTGVRGVATALTGGGNGGSFQTAGPTGAGVRGFSTATSGESYGVYGKAVSPAGYSGYFEGRMKTTGDAIVAGNLTATTLSGSGGGLTGLHATNLTSGTVDDARLSGMVAREDISNSFGPPQVFSAGTAASPSVTLFGGGNGLFAPNSATMAIATGGTERLRIDSNGRFGIGITAPVTKMHMVGNGGPPPSPSYNLVADMVIEDSTFTGIQLIGDTASALFFGNNASTSGFAVYHNVTADSLNFQSGTTSVLTLDGVSNRIGIGTTNPSTTLHVVGTITGTTKNFLIDHPQDPLNSFLRHGCVESDEYKNVYDGVVTTDAKGYATVVLPSWFESLNEKFRYQLTVLDDSEEFVLAKVTKKIEGNRFTIRTSRPSVEVSWQVTGVRKDAYVRDNPLIVEEKKPMDWRGKLVYEGSASRPEAKPRGK